MPKGGIPCRAKKVYLVFDASPIVNASGNIIAAIETLHDMTELKMAEEISPERILRLRKLTINSSQPSPRFCSRRKWHQ